MSGFEDALSMMRMKEPVIDIDCESIIKLDLFSTSKGNQTKYYDTINHNYIKEQFYYQGRYWEDYKVEHISSVLSNMTDTLDVSIVKQEVVKLSNGLYACMSYDFSYDTGYQWISINRLLNGMVPDRGNSDKVFYRLCKTINRECNIDITNYLIIMIIFDFLLGNEDRHYNNFGVLFYNREFKIAPLFDFGLGLFEHDRKYENADLDNAILRMDGKPFNRVLLQPIEMLIRNGFGSYVNQVVSKIIVPDKLLFPSDLGYDYFQSALKTVKELV